MTFDTLHWLNHTGRLNQFTQLPSPQAMSQFITGIINPEGDAALTKGLNMIQYEALFEWACEKRGFVVATGPWAYQLLTAVAQEIEVSRLTYEPAPQQLSII